MKCATCPIKRTQEQIIESSKAVGVLVDVTGRIFTRAETRFETTDVGGDNVGTQTVVRSWFVRVSANRYPPVADDGNLISVMHCTGTKHATKHENTYVRVTHATSPASLKCKSTAFPAAKTPRFFTYSIAPVLAVFSRWADRCKCAAPFVFSHRCLPRNGWRRQ